jgi:uncharacterized integral membrane protein
MFLILQLPTDPPATLAAFNWVVIGGLVAALVYVFRLWQLEKKNCTQRYIETIDKLMDALHDQVDDDD